MTVSITQDKTPDGLQRVYTAKVKAGKRKGETFGPVVVMDAGQGWGQFWAAAKRHFGTDQLFTG